MRVINTYTLFQEITEKLLTMLAELSPEQWMAPTCYPTWKVKDITAHLLQSGLGRLSVQRDKFSLFDSPAPEFESLSSMIDSFNTNWTEIFSSVSPSLLLDMISITEKQLSDFILKQDLFSRALYGVTWAGEDVSENWFDLGREYTERWHHQQQIRDAVGAEPITDRKYLYPVIQLFMLSLPFWYKDMEAAEGSSINIKITGKAGGDWSLQRSGFKWIIKEEHTESPMLITLSDDTAWRFFSRSSAVDSFRDKIVMSEDNNLLQNFMNAKAIMIND